jgi:hypothetical protein
MTFAYLAVIPAALVGATVDPACAGTSCDYSPPLTVYLVIAFGLCGLALAAAALGMAAFAVRPTGGNARLVRRALKAAVAAVALLLFTELALPYPVAAVVIVALCVPVVLLGAARGRAKGSGSPTARPPKAGTRRAPG